MKRLCFDRCDSGNGSDIMHSSGNVSPAYSDYGGGIRTDIDEQSDSISRQTSKESSLGSPESSDPNITPTAPEDKQITSSRNNSSSDGLTTPTVMVWPAPTSSSQTMMSRHDSNDNELIAHSPISDVEDVKKKGFNWSLSFDQEECHGVSTSGVSSEVVASPDSINEYPNMGSRPPTLVHRQTSESLISKAPQHMTRQLSDSLSSFNYIQDRVLSRPSADSLSSLDGYFSQIPNSYDNLTPDSATDSAFAPVSTTPHVFNQLPPKPR